MHLKDKLSSPIFPDLSILNLTGAMKFQAHHFQHERHQPVQSYRTLTGTKLLRHGFHSDNMDYGVLKSFWHPLPYLKDKDQLQSHLHEQVRRELSHPHYLNDVMVAGIALTWLKRTNLSSCWVQFWVIPAQRPSPTGSSGATTLFVRIWCCGGGFRDRAG